MPQWLPRILLGMLSVGYQIFFLIVGSIIYYLFPDVIPERFIGRFMALFSLTGSLAGFIFSRWLLPFGENHLGWLFTAVSLFYLAVIVLMGRTVREGAYPPPDDAGKPFSPVGMVRSYFRDCYSIPFYYSFFIMMALSDVSTVCRAMFNFLYAKNTLGLSYAEFGEIMGWGGVVGVLLSFPVGLLVDRFHALRVYAFGLLLVVAVNLFSFFLVHDYRSFLVSSLLLAVVYTIQGAATLPCFVAILPKAYYGQFSSANALLRAAFMAVCGAGGGAGGGPRGAAGLYRTHHRAAHGPLPADHRHPHGADPGRLGACEPAEPPHLGPSGGSGPAFDDSGRGAGLADP